MSVQGKINFILIRELISEAPEDSTRMYLLYIPHPVVRVYKVHSNSSLHPRKPKDGKPYLINFLKCLFFLLLMTTCVLLGVERCPLKFIY